MAAYAEAIGQPVQTDRRAEPISVKGEQGCNGSQMGHTDDYSDRPVHFLDRWTLC
jgi:hypothetical protein